MTERTEKTFGARGAQVAVSAPISEREMERNLYVGSRVYTTDLHVIYEFSDPVIQAIHRARARGITEVFVSPIGTVHPLGRSDRAQPSSELHDFQQPNSRSDQKPPA